MAELLNGRMARNEDGRMGSVAEWQNCDAEGRSKIGIGRKQMGY